jgi:hypothetical protein
MEDRVPIPDVPANVDPLKQAGRFDLRNIVGDPTGWRRRPLSGAVFADGVVDLLDLGEDGS